MTTCAERITRALEDAGYQALSPEAKARQDLADADRLREAWKERAQDAEAALAKFKGNYWRERALTAEAEAHEAKAAKQQTDGQNAALRALVASLEADNERFRMSNARYVETFTIRGVK